MRSVPGCFISKLINMIYKKNRFDKMIDSDFDVVLGGFLSGERWLDVFKKGRAKEHEQEQELNRARAKEQEQRRML